MLKVQLSIVLTFFIVTKDAQALSVETAPKMKWLEDPSTCRPCTDSCTANTKTNLCCMRKTMPYKTIEKAPMLDCKHIEEEKCHHTYVTEYDSIKEEVCEDTYDKNCHLTFKKMPFQEEVETCYTPMNKKCKEYSKDNANEICQIVYESSCTTKYKELSKYYKRGIVDVSGSNLVATFPKWSRYYEIEFDIIVQSKPPTDEYVNVLHMSNIETEDGEGSKIPAVYVNNDFFKFCCGNNDCYITKNVNTGYKINTLYHIKITQERNLAGKWMFKVNHINFQLEPIENPDQETKGYENVKLYVSDPWTSSFRSYGIVSNLEVTDLTENQPIPVSDEELKATFCLYDLDKKDGLSITELSDKIGQFHTLLRTGFHNENTNEIKDTFNLVDETGDGSISLDEWIEFGKSNKFNLDNRQVIVDRLTNALESKFFKTDKKVDAVNRLIFCACDADANEEISEAEIKDENCVAIQQSIFHDNYITGAGFDFLRRVETDDSQFTLEEANTALTNIIDTDEVYNKFFTGDNARFIASGRREAMSALSVKRQSKEYTPKNEPIQTRRQARWLGETTCEQIPVKMCGNGCTFENGQKICQMKTEHSLIDVPMEMCDINPRPVCKFQTKLVPKLIPQKQCFKIPREKCELKYEPKEVKKTYDINWCRPLDPNEDCSTSFQIDDPVNAGECCTEDANKLGQCLDCTATSQIEDPDNLGTCCTEDSNNLRQCLCTATSQIEDPDNPGTCCDEDPNASGTCQ